MSSKHLLALACILPLAFSIHFAAGQEAVEETSPTTETASPSGSHQKAPEIRSRKSIQELMTPEEFKAAGLDKLNEDELQHLDAWLQGYRQTAEKRATAVAEKRASEEVQQVKQAAAKTSKTSIDTEVSRIDGNFMGLTGKTIIKLEDGTVWKQANAEDRYSGPVTDHPLVSVKHSAFGYKMRIEGTPEFYVNPVR